MVPARWHFSSYLFSQFPSPQRCSLPQQSYWNPTNLWDSWNFFSLKPLITPEMMFSELPSAHRFLPVHYVFLCLSDVPTRISSLSSHLSFLLSSATWVPSYGTQHRIGLWTDWLTRCSWGTGTILLWCPYHPHHPNVLMEWRRKNDSSGSLSRLVQQVICPKWKEGIGTWWALKICSVLWLYDLSE